QWLTLAYAYIFAVSFYEGYIIGIFSFVFLLAVMGVEYGREWKKYLSCLMRLAGTVLLAVLMAAAVLVPMVCYLLWDAAPDSSTFQGLEVTLPDIINNLFLGEMQTEDGMFPQVYCGLLVFYLFPCFFMERSIERKKKVVPLVLLCFLLICSLWGSAYLMMHGFDTPNGSGFRFSYFYSFVLVSIGCLVWKKAEAVTKKRIYFCGITAVIFYFCMLVWQKNRLQEEYLSSSVMGLEINAVILVVLGLLLLMKKAQKYQKALPIIMALFVSAELILNGVLVSIRVDYDYAEYKVIYDNWWKQTKTVTDTIREEDSGMYRIQYLNGILCNQAPLFDYMGIGLFSSVEDVKVRDTLYHLGYYTSPRVVYDYGGSTFTRMIFGEKYIVKALGADIAYNGERTWEKNPEALALGYMVSEDILKVSLDSDNAMENQNRLIQGMTGQPLELFIPIENGYSIELDNVLLGIYTEEGEEWWEAYIENPDDPNGKMIYHISNSSEQPVYAYFAMSNSIEIKASPLLYSSIDHGNYYAGAYLTTPRCIEAGQNEYGDAVVVMEMNETTSDFAYYKGAYFSYYDAAAVTEAYKQLCGHQLEIQERKGSHIEAVVEATEELPVLFLSIPYEEGWEIRVDGMQVEPMAVVNDTFLAISLEPGIHRIEMEYHSFADQIGRILSCLGAGIWLILCFNIWKREKTDMNQEKKATNENVNEQYIN
ncbi:MAG: YfhO family protein, partial [Lachnospiraceae bacterium]